MRRRALLGLSAAALVRPAFAAGGTRIGIDLTGVAPPLAFSMVRAADGRVVTGQDYRGKVVLLFFGYTSCPDECPLTMGNLARMLGGMGRLADGVRVLFVTVDPARDTLAVLARYTRAFAPQIDGLRGTQDALTRLGRRYRVAWSVHGTEVSHSSSLFLFDPAGAARRLFPPIDTADADLAPLSHAVRALAAGTPGSAGRS